MNNMQICIYSNVPADSWRREILPSFHPLALPVAGKALCCHLIDFCTYFRTEREPVVLLADCNYSEEMALSLGDGNYWALRLDYRACRPFSSPGELLDHFKVRFGRDDVLLFWGAVLPAIASREEIFKNMRLVAEPMQEQPDGIYLYVGGKLFQWCCPLHRMDTLKDYYELNFRLLREPGLYDLPGYSPERGYGLGRNVNLKAATEVGRPVILGDNINLEGGVKLGGDTIVGMDVWIDEDTVIDHSIILDHTYIGRDLLIKDRIVSGNRVIDPEQNVYVELEDAFLAEDIRGAKACTRTNEKADTLWFGEAVIAFFLGILEFPLYLLALAIPKRDEKQPFVYFLLKRYPKLWKVVFRRAQLVRHVWGLEYVFRYSDLWPMMESERQKRLDDLYFRHHRNLPRIFAIAVGSQLKKLFVYSGNFTEHKVAEKVARR